jgi:hypothetical protein
VPYGEPQDNGSRQDVRWLALFDDSDAGVMFVAEGNEFAFSALPYTIEDLDQAKHLNEINPSGYTTLCIDTKQRGVGNGVDTPRKNTEGFLLREYAVEPVPVAFSYSMRPLSTTGVADLAKKGRVNLPVLSKPFIARNDKGYVTISSSVSDADIYYTLDGTVPASKSKKYSKPFLLTSKSTVKAVALKDGFIDGEVQINELSQMQVLSPSLSPGPGSFFKTLSVRAESATDDVEIYYTIDGSQPTKESEKYNDKIVITDDVDIKIKAFKNGYKPSVTILGKYSNYKPSRSGVYYRYYVGEWRTLPDYNKLIPEKEGYTDKFSFMKIENNKTHFSLQMFGVIKIEKEGNYIFTVGSNDGSQLFVNGVLAADNNGDHGYKEESGEVHLKPGEHLVEIRYFQIGGGQDLFVFYEGPGIEKQIISVQ